MRAAARRSQGKDDGTSRWLTTYADLVTLLLAFFVLLFTMSEIDATKFRELLQGLASPFGNTGEQSNVLDGGETITSDEPFADHTVLSIFDDMDHLDDEADDGEDGENGEADDGDEEQEAEPTDDLAALREEIEAALDAAELDHHAELDLDPRGLVISIGTDSVLFETGSTRISSTGREIIAAIAPPLQPIGNEVLVEGHADTVPISRQGYDNWNLSADRALAVLRLLKDGHQLEPGRLAATGYGEHRPRASNDSAAGRRQNRRVDILITAEEDA